MKQFDENECILVFKKVIKKGLFVAYEEDIKSFLNSTHSIVKSQITVTFHKNKALVNFTNATNILINCLPCDGEVGPIIIVVHPPGGNPIREEINVILRNNIFDISGSQVTFFRMMQQWRVG